MRLGDLLGIHVPFEWALIMVVLSPVLVTVGAGIYIGRSWSKYHLFPKGMPIVSGVAPVFLGLLYSLLFNMPAEWMFFSMLPVGGLMYVVMRARERRLEETTGRSWARLEAEAAAAKPPESADTEG